jgi:hypothetical protein
LPDNSSLGYFFERIILRRIILYRKVLRSDDSSPENSSLQLFFVRAGHSSPDDSLPEYYSSPDDSSLEKNLWRWKILCRMILRKENSSTNKKKSTETPSSGFVRIFFDEIRLYLKKRSFEILKRFSQRR